MRTTVGALLICVLVLTAAVACGTPDVAQPPAPATDDGPAPTLMPHRTKPTLPPVVAPSTTTPPPSRVPHDSNTPDASALYAVGLTTMSFTDATRPATARGSETARDTRSLVTQIRYPAVGPTNSPESKLEPSKIGGPFPLVVFIHGFNSSASKYDQLLHQIAAGGYIVVAPDFPGTSSALPGPPVEADVANQPADVKFIISRLLTVNDQPGDLQGLILPEKIAVIGHSDGGNTAAATAYNQCCLDTRIKAAVMLAAEKTFFPDTWFVGQGPPYLGIHGDNDDVTPFQNGRDLYRGAGPPKYFVTVRGGNHEDPYMGGIESPATAKLVVAFLGGYLRGDSTAVVKLRADGNQAPFRLESAAL